MPIRHGNTYRALGWLIASICLWAIPALGQTQEPKAKAETAAPEAQQADPAKPPPTPKQKQPTPKKQALCDEAKAGPESDLCQQWRMAQAAEKQVHWTRRLYFLTFWEIGALVLTLLATAAAAIAAVIAARAARDAVKIASNTAEYQLRAYVAQEIIIWTPIKQPGSKTINGYNLTIRWKNCGSTPARRCRTRLNVGFFEKGLPKDFDYPDPPTGKAMPSTEKSHMAPNGTITNTLGITVAEAQAAQRGKSKIFAWGWTEYDDIFEGTARRRTEICVEVVISPDGRSITPAITGPFNGADADCHHKPKT